jgi:hypothetical protein
MNIPVRGTHIIMPKDRVVPSVFAHSWLVVGTHNMSIDPMLPIICTTQQPQRQHTTPTTYSWLIRRGGYHHHTNDGKEESNTGNKLHHHGRSDASDFFMKERLLSHPGKVGAMYEDSIHRNRPE